MPRIALSILLAAVTLTVYVTSLTPPNDSMQVVCEESMCSLVAIP